MGELHYICRNLKLASDSRPFTCNSYANRSSGEILDVDIAKETERELRTMKMVVMHFGKSMLKPQPREIVQIMSEPERPLNSKCLDLFGECLVFQVLSPV